MREEDKASGCSRNYAAILMDINMPVMDGIEATKILKELMHSKLIKSIPIIAVTAAQCRNEAEKESYLKMGFDEFGKRSVTTLIVEKPITLVKIRSVLNKFGVL